MMNVDAIDVRKQSSLHHVVVDFNWERMVDRVPVWMWERGALVFPVYSFVWSDEDYRVSLPGNGADPGTGSLWLSTPRTVIGHCCTVSIAK